MAFEAMFRWPDYGAVLIDAIFGANHVKFYSFTFIVFDNFAMTC